MSGWYERPKRKTNGARRFGRSPILPGGKQRSPYFIGGTLQWLMVAVGFIILVAALTRPTQQNIISQEDIDKPIPEQDFKAEFDFQAVDHKATNEARDMAAAKVPDYYSVDQSRVQQQWFALGVHADDILKHQNAVELKILQALRDSNSLQQAEPIVKQAITDYIAVIPQEERESLPDGPILQTWLMPDLATLPVRQFEPLPEPTATDPTANSADSAESKTESATASAAATLTSPIPPVENTPRKVLALKGNNPETEPRLLFTRSQALKKLAQDGLDHILNLGVRPKALIGSDEARIVRTDNAPSLDRQGRAPQGLLKEAPAPEDAIALLNEWLVDAAKRMAMEAGAPNDWSQYHEAALAMAQKHVVDTIQYDKGYTDGARAKAQDSVPPVMKTILANEIMQEANHPWSAQSKSDVKAYREILHSDRDVSQQVLSAMLAHIVLIALLLAALYRSVEVFGSLGTHDFLLDPKEARRYFNLALLIMCTTVLVGRLVLYFEPTGFILPVATGAILFAILVNIRLAVVVGTLLAILASVQYNYDWRVFVVAFAMSLAGVYSIQKVRRRSDMTTASLKATLVGLLIIIALSLAVDSLLSEAALRRLTLIALNGGLCLVLVPSLLTPLERMFGITTDILLLEYSDLNNPVLNRMAIETPATFSHSLMLGQLAEAAADAISANGLMARVCAYYHDIGKMRKPEYFCENQTDENIHDKITPRMSARAIAAHVQYGVELARAHHLPQPIIDGILEHHGTCMIGYFYQLAKKDDKHGDAREEEFRYPGPKPQRPETAILMICDAVESGIRSIKNLNEERTRDFVDKIVASRLEDRQFDDCNLTLKELDIIAEVVTQRILATMHKRISYPNDKKEENSANIIPMTGGAG